MKITAQLVPDTGKKTITQNNHDAYFDVLLNSSTRETTGDDYYRQYQHQMQQSELTFHSLATRIKKPANNDVEGFETHINTPSEMPYADEQSSCTGIEPKNDITKPVSSLMLPLEQFVLAIKTMREQASMPLENKRIENIEKDTDSTPVRINQLPEKNIIFKHHQLFLNNNLAELTLNTTQLSKDETNELQRLIKRWLANKGYTLKQFIINGVPQ